MELDVSYYYAFNKFIHKIDLSNAVKTENIKEYLLTCGSTNTDIDERKIVSFVLKAEKKWRDANRCYERFVKNNSDWLKKNLLNVVQVISQKIPSDKRKNFSELSDSQKRRRTEDLRQEEKQKLVFATTSALRKNNLPAAKLMVEMEESPGRALKILNAYKTTTTTVSSYTPDEALALVVESRLSRNCYNYVRKSLKKKANDHILPTYNHDILYAKRQCYPDGLIITETEALVDLQNMLDLTAFRITKTFDTKSMPMPEECILYVKWGFDGSSGHTSFKQIFETEGVSDASILSTTIAPIRLVGTNGIVIWTNPAPNSSRYCRPLRISYEKESTESLLSEHDRVNDEINKLIPMQIEYPDGTLQSITYHLILSMVDGKAINAIEDNPATTVCYVCQSKPSTMNDLSKSEQIIDLNTDHAKKLQYGLSPLHAWINFFEFLLHLSYRLELPEDKRKKYSRKTEAEDAILKATKEKIQNRFQKEMGLIVDQPKPGFGSTNDGNTARRFFKDPVKTASITGLNEDVITRFRNVLITINQSAEVNPSAFRKYALETAQLYVSMYEWYQMSPTIHKVLVHGADFIQYSVLPLGDLSEESQEAAHKHFKEYRQRFARKTSRVDNMRDIMNRFLVTTDPYIVHLGECNSSINAKKNELPTEVYNLLYMSQMEDFYKSAQEEDEEDDEDETESNDDLF